MKKRLSADEIERMKSEMAELPVGCVSCKTIKGAKRYYRQWVEDGRTRSEYLPVDKVAEVREQIARRRELVKDLKPYLTVAGASKGTVAGAEVTVSFAGNTVKGVTAQERVGHQRYRK